MLENLSQKDLPLVQATFILEQHLGHRAYYLNLRRFIACEPAVQARWTEVTYENPGNWWNRLPGVPGNLRGVLNGRQQAIEAARKPDAGVLFFNTQVPAAIMGGELFKHPFVLSTDITPIQYDRMAGYYNHKLDRMGWLKSYKFRANQQIFKRAAYLAPWSTWAAQSLIDDYGADPQRVEVVAPGVDVEIWKPDPLLRAANAVPKILFVGGHLERKGGLELLAAYQSLPPGTAELILVTRSTVAPMPGVTIINNLQPNDPALVRLYQQCDLFVLPSKAEAFGIAAAEACAAGLPVIATAVGGLTDIVKHEETGLLVSSGSAAELADAIYRLLADPDLRRACGQAARTRAEQFFNAQTNAMRILKLIVQAGEEAHLNP